MKKIKILVLTDHSMHSEENSLYSFLPMLFSHPQCLQIDVATRHNTLNNFFFQDHIAQGLFVSSVDETFAFHTDGRSFKKNLRKERLDIYDVVWLRLPPPLTLGFLDFLTATFAKQLIVNAPTGIYKTGSKEFLMQFPEICPPMKICTTIEDIIEFKNQFPIVLKPFREYGGKGILKIEGNQVWEGQHLSTFEALSNQAKGEQFAYLGVKYLKNVTQGDKRIIVICGEIMGASLRLPATNSWLCNVSQGGTAVKTSVTEEEKQIVARINPILSNMGIAMYGVDTLVNDEGKRILSEINATSIGGLPQLAQQLEKPLVEEGMQLMMEYMLSGAFSIT